MWLIHRWLFLLIACLMTGHLMFATQVHAAACQCGSSPEQANVQFVGTVIGKDSPLLYGLIGAVASNLQGLSYSQGVMFSVEQAWAGVSREEITIRTGGGDACGIDFVRGQQYFVSATFGRNGHPQTSICHTTLPLLDAGNEVAALSAETQLPLKPVPRVTFFEAAVFAILILLVYWWIFMVRAIRANPLRF